MKICYFGDYYPEYSRNNIIIKGLRRNGVSVLECWDNSRGIKRYINLARKHKAIKDKYDLLIVGYSNSRFPVILARLISRKKVIWNPLYSIYESRILDRHFAAKNSLKGWYYYILDWIAVWFVNRILLDTNENIDFFNKTFGVGKSKFKRVFVGADEDLLKPSEERNKIFTVHFHGYFIPFHGVGIIIKAAKILERYPIRFDIIGSGQTYDSNMELARSLNIKNISFTDEASYSELAEIIGRADICLGVFGNTERVDRVIPNKVFEAVAAAKPVITAESKAVQELFQDNKSILFCKKGSPESLAEKILILYNNAHLREELAKNCFAIYSQFATPEAIGKDLSIYLTKLFNE